MREFFQDGPVITIAGLVFVVLGAQQVYVGALDLKTYGTLVVALLVGLGLARAHAARG